MVSRFISFGPTEPCALWQSEQVILPSRIGVPGGPVRLGALRLVAGVADFGLGELREHLVLGRVDRSGRLAQVTSRVWCVLPSQCERLLSLLWQAMQVPLLSSADMVFLPGFFIGVLPRAFTCSVASPWHDEHSPEAAAPRALPFWPWIEFAYEATSSSWHLAQAWAPGPAAIALPMPARPKTSPLMPAAARSLIRQEIVTAPPQVRDLPACLGPSRHPVRIARTPALPGKWSDRSNGIDRSARSRTVHSVRQLRNPVDSDQLLAWNRSIRRNHSPLSGSPHESAGSFPPLASRRKARNKPWITAISVEAASRSRPSASAR